MKQYIFSVLAALVISLSHAQTNSKVYYVELIEGQDIDANPIKESEAKSEGKGISIRIYPDISFQTIKGIGGAFNEIGGEALMSLSKSQQNEIMKNLFDVNGANFTVCRTAIGASDFGIDAYSYSEVSNDYKMKKFSIEREKTSVIPFIQMAYKYNPEMELFASPWSPPGWMKESGVMDRGEEFPEKNILKNNPKVYEAYALYFSKYVEAYAKEGISVDKIVIQNEQDISTKYPSNHMPPEEMGEFVIKYLRPQFNKAKTPAEIYAGTFRTAKRLDGLEFVNNTNYREAVDGVGVQYMNSRQIENMQSVYPDINFLHTEGICFGGKNSIDQAFSRFNEVASFINHGVPNFCYWNMILNEDSSSGWGWKQNSLIKINRKEKTVTYNPDYAAMALFGRFMKPGMKRVASASWYGDTITLADDDNVYLFIKNDSDKVKTFDIWLKDDHAQVVDIPANTISVVEVNYKK
ncbi:glycoside hydrolase family 30 protein [Polaribacter sp. Asnod1-A03]|uniref:glycoside hydrolase family 30 protein n=1 Tax=Polaribacter sp. Asnod1-A03 TaxID=3160581 RepID=UPI00386B7D58